ncbi:MAG: hypothetical protein HY746_01100 [Elusimicrobia bacterium]|nr:hypothetical protein [Elusimicrobiota bacterium]
MAIFPLIKILSGLFFLIVGLGFILRPGLIERVSRLIKETILNESRLALNREKLGFFFVLAGILLFYMGITRIK